MADCLLLIVLPFNSSLTNHITMVAQVSIGPNKKIKLLNHHNME